MVLLLAPFLKEREIQIRNFLNCATELKFRSKPYHFGRTLDHVQTYYCYGGGKNKKATFSLAEFKLYNVPITL